jgi:hypothetical protein
VSVVLQILGQTFCVVVETERREFFRFAFPGVDVDGRLMFAGAQRIVFLPFVRIFEERQNEN